MNDRELLELAARAAGAIDTAAVSRSWDGFQYLRVLWKDDGDFVDWNPIKENADAFSLALSVPHLNLQWLIAEAFQAHPDDAEAREQYARLMIVEFSAKFGRAMP